MSYVKHNWFTGEVIEASYLNHIEQGIYELSIAPVPSTATYISQTLTAGQTTVTFSSPLLTGDKLIDVYTSVAGLGYESMTSSTGQVTVEYEAQSTNITVTLEIREMT